MPGRKYLCGRFINHSSNPNVKFEISARSTLCVALRTIARDEELLVDYIDNWNQLRKLGVIC